MRDHSGGGGPAAAGVIVEVDTYVVTRTGGNPYRWRRGIAPRTGSGADAWIRLVTEDGVDGWAFVPHHGVAASTIVRDMIAEPILGQNLLNTEALWRLMWDLDRGEEFPIWLFGAIDVAAWDAKAKHANLPVYQMLGGARSELDVYASLVTFPTIEDYLSVIDRCIEAGFRAIKLHAWGDRGADAKLSEAVRDHVGSGVELMYDGSGAFDLLDAMRLGQVLEELDYLWYEEPIRDFSVTAYERLAHDLRIPILVGETSDGMHFNAAEWIVRGACDMIRTGTDLKGGFTGALRIAHLADAFEMRAEVAGGGPANLHLAFAVPNTTYYESMVSSADSVGVEELNENGAIAAPTGAGIGWQPNLVALREGSVEQSSTSR